MYGNTLLNIHFKHLNRDTSKVLSCRAQLASLSLDHTGHRSSVIKKKKEATSTMFSSPSVPLPNSLRWLHFADRINKNHFQYFK